MPTYEYTCRDCGHTFDIVQSMWDEPLTMCPECGGSLRKVFAPPAISFKGSGFYATDHGKKAKARSGEKPGDAPGDGKESGTTGKESGTTKETPGKRGTAEKGTGTGAGPTETSSRKEPATS